MKFKVKVKKFLILLLFMLPMPLLMADECLKKLRSEGFDYTFDVNYSDLQPLRMEAFQKVKSARGSANQYIENTLTGDFAMGDKQYKCEFNERYVECGPLFILLDEKIIKDQNIRISLPFSWNRSFKYYFPSEIVYLNDVPHFALGANNNLTLKQDGEDNYSKPDLRKTEFQPKLPSFPRLSPYENLKPIKYAKYLDFESGGWYKFVSSCSADTGSRESHILNMLLIPINKYGTYIDNWEDSMKMGGYTPVLHCKSQDAACIERLKRVSNNLTSLFSREDVIPVSLRLDVNATLRKINLAF